MSVTDYLPFSIRLLKGTGLAPSSNLVRKFIAITFLLPVTLVMNCMIIVNFGLAAGDVLVITETFESLSTFGQLTVRKYIFLAHGRLIEEIIKDCHQQWTYDLFGPDLEAELKQKMAFCIKLSKILFGGTIVTISMMGIVAFVDPTKLVPLLCWIPNVKWAPEIIFISEFLILFEAIYYVIATDSFYLLVGMDLQIQFRLMSELIRSIRFGVDEDSECLTKLTKCAQHHRWLLRLHEKLNRVFSEYFIMQYSITVSAVAIQVYLAMYRTPTVDAIIKSIVYFITIMFQVALYFIPASNIEIAAENFSQELYFANWEANSNVKISKHLLVMLMKSQKTLNMLGAGMLHVNRPEYLIIIRLGFTIATILGGLK